MANVLDVDQADDAARLTDAQKCRRRRTQLVSQRRLDADVAVRGRGNCSINNILGLTSSATRSMGFLADAVNKVDEGNTDEDFVPESASRFRSAS